MAKHLQITDIDTTDDMPASKGYVDTEVAGAGGGASVLDDLTDVVISTPSNGQVLKYDSGTSKWVNGTDATGGAGSLSDGDYGDITVSGTGTVMNIDAGVVTTTELGGDITTAGKALLDDANAAAQLTTLGLTATATELNYTDGVTSSIQTQLDGKASSSHTHTSSNITDFDEAVEDKIGAKVAAGTGISVSYNDTTGVTTVTSTAGDVYTTVGSSGASYTTVGDAITAGATKIAVITDVTEAGSITIPVDGVLLGLNQSIEVTMPSGGNVTIEDRAKMSEISIVLDTGKVVLNDSSSATRTVLSKSSSTGYILEFAGQSGKFVDGRIYDTATPLSTSRVVIRKYDCHFESNYCEITDAGTTTGTAWMRMSNVSGDVGASHVITGNYFFGGAAGVKTTWASGSYLMCCQYADGVISENNFDGPVSRGTAIVMEDYHESISDNYFNAFETQLVLSEVTGSMSADTYRTEVVGNKFAQPSGRCVYCSGYGNSFLGNTFSCTNQTINFNPSTSSSTKGRYNSIIGGQVRSGNIVFGANSQDNIVMGVAFLSSATVSDSGTGNKYFMNTGTSAPADSPAFAKLAGGNTFTGAQLLQASSAEQIAATYQAKILQSSNITSSDYTNLLKLETTGSTYNSGPLLEIKTATNSTSLGNNPQIGLINKAGGLTKVEMIAQSAAQAASGTVAENAKGKFALFISPGDVGNTDDYLGINSRDNTDSSFSDSILTVKQLSAGGTMSFMGDVLNIASGFLKFSTTLKGISTPDGTQLDFANTTGAVNYLRITHAATGNRPELKAVGSDTNVDLLLSAQGSGTIRSNNAIVVSSQVQGTSIVPTSTGVPANQGINAPASNQLGLTAGGSVRATVKSTELTMAVPINMGSNLITNVTDPSSAQDAATRNYVDTGLSGKAASTHTHTASEVTDFSEAVDDRVSALLTAGSNITLTYNDVANTLTIDASGGGSGLTHPEIMARISMGF